MATLAVLALAGCTSSSGDDTDAAAGLAADAGRELEAVAERLEHFQGFAGDGVLVSPFLARGSAQVPDFDFDVEEGYVLTIYCLGDTGAVDVHIDGEPSGPEPMDCRDGQITMARNAPDMSAAESDILVSAEGEDAYWLAGVTRSTDAYRAVSEDVGSSRGGTIELAVSQTCTLASDADCALVDGEPVTIAPSQFISAGVKEADAVPDGVSSDAVRLQLDDQGASTLHSLSAEVAELGEEGRLLVKVGDEMLSALRVPAALDGSDVQIALGDDTTARSVIERIREG
ncbi:hypothetical protein SAMN05216184_11573 [Georgenia satyanarayanai]|uniref:Uncharacterized protein n=1 Tax=Georgenia satyanarayanai TaxID=860221 RepID=A0A2Y9APR2_9MICO|nr:hypothetical protein [Georgenia satyanarayanai]PYF97364.1 hypothetical protein A8987_11573 [Georgenia satyanarayanai]SSA46145.1 hypothetical protein SAMN05216184_11573 [Georgenia satyanarayanai]